MFDCHAVLRLQVKWPIFKTLLPPPSIIGLNLFVVLVVNFANTVEAIFPFFQFRLPQQLFPLLYLCIRFCLSKMSFLLFSFSSVNSSEVPTSPFLLCLMPILKFANCLSVPVQPVNRSSVLVVITNGVYSEGKSLNLYWMGF